MPMVLAAPARGRGPCAESGAGYFHPLHHGGELDRVRTVGERAADISPRVSDNTGEAAPKGMPMPR